ncbi:hypothetical protein TGAMA5MH_10717 [Trichoderma gamsii]|uniref:Uncharacterized protein n=1 Tax=Trichoderma gamsii TaxID=398673 RepID=A0A2K0SVP2_9HYPO|nr:hypothetical protein TGAMA5MH_10717 [Trichoderma gamsii]
MESTSKTTSDLEIVPTNTPVETPVDQPTDQTVAESAGRSAGQMTADKTQEETGKPADQSEEQVASQNDQNTQQTNEEVGEIDLWERFPGIPAGVANGRFTGKQLEAVQNIRKSKTGVFFIAREPGFDTTEFAVRLVACILEGGVVDTSTTGGEIKKD